MFAGLAKGFGIVVYLWSCASAVAAQNLTVPSETWRKPTSNLSRDLRASLAHDAAVPLSAIHVAISEPGLPHPQEITGLYTVFILQDYYSGNSTWHDMGTVKLLSNVQGPNGFFDAGRKLYTDVLYWGLAFFYSYRTYNESFLLDNAVESWNIVYTDAFINSSSASSGSGARRSVSFSPSDNCTGGTFAGGVFARQDILNDTSVNMETVGPFMTLSAYLYEETKNTTYQQTAQLSLDFIINYMWNGSIAYDTIYLGSCQFTPEPFTLNQAWFVEGLSVWANVTQNTTLKALLEVVVPNVTTFPSWSSQGGIVNDRDPLVLGDSPNEILKGIFIRGLAEARVRNPETDLARYIEAYITVQFNAVLDNARATAPPDNSYFSRAWVGPPTTSYETGGTIAALDVLNAAVNLVAPSTLSTPNSTTSSPTSTSTSTQTSTKSESSNTGAIAGGVVGGVLAAVAVVATVIVRRRQRHARTVNQVENSSGVSPNNFVEPFISRPAYNPPALSKLERMNEAHPGSAPSLPAPPPVPASRDQVPNHEPIDIAELPSLVQRLNNFLQGRQGELPPHYDD